jgi:transcription elongation factor Elf1
MSLPIDSKYVRLLSSRLRNFKQKKDYLWNFSCPICGDSQKNKTKARGYVFAKGNNLFYRCHNCGISTSVGNFVKAVDESLYREYVLERYKSGETNNTRSANTMLDIPSPKFDKVEKQKVFEHAEWCDKLPSGHFCLDYLIKRQIPKQYYSKLLFTQHYKQFCDTLVPNHGKTIVDDARLVIPFYDEYNELIAISGRALETGDKTLRYVTIRANESKDKLLFGLDRLNKNEAVKIVEGPIDSLFLNNCIASGDANLALTSESLNISSDKIILIYDNEPRNKEIVKLMANAIKLNHNVVIWPDYIAGKDINEMILGGIALDEIEKIISNNTFKGLEAQTKFVFWKKV